MSSINRRSLINAPSVGISKGQTGDEVDRIQNYLMKFGYIQPKEETILGAKIDKKKAISVPKIGEFDDNTEKALKLFQQINHLPITGNLNKETLNLMLRPRCGMPDIIETSSELEEFNLYGTKWDRTDLTYYFQSTTNDTEPGIIREAIRAGFDAWSSVSPLTFREVESNGDFKIRWGVGDHGDDYPFDGPSEVLAHCFFPKTGMDGQLCFDDSELWKNNASAASGEIDIRIVAVHEIGHGLGIKHSQIRDAIMYPYYDPQLGNLRADDISAIQAIYGSS
jgi:hypothetical protein